MDSVANICAESKDLINLLNNPIITADNKKAVLSKVFSSADTVSKDFISFLVDKKRGK